MLTASVCTGWRANMSGARDVPPPSRLHRTLRRKVARACRARLAQWKQAGPPEHSQ